MTDPNLSLVLDEVDNAKQKHPHFVDHFLLLVRQERADTNLNVSRAILQNATQNGDATFADVIQCELDEAFQAYAHGDLAHARQELAQCAAVCIRGMEYIEKEQTKGESAP